MEKNVFELVEAEGWKLKQEGKEYKILAYDQVFPLTHPVLIHLKRYREERIAGIKFEHMKKAHNYLWPQDIKTWHSWTEDRFREHCVGWNYMSWAGCASSTKSYDAAKIAILFWMANPKHRAVMVASTTLTAMGRRVWGYVTTLLTKMKVPLKYQYYSGNAPQILYPCERGTAKDYRHAIIACAAKQGSDETAISNFIGTHPDEAMMMILDEGTDLPVSLMNSIANLKNTEKPFQLIIIGNSNDQYDLHGSLSTPEEGWGSIDPLVHTAWKTTQRNGICLYFNAYNSPAINETDPVKKKLLSAFLPTEKTVKEAEETYGKESLQFWRFTLGFWKPSSVASTMMSKEFIGPKDVMSRAHWLGMEPLRVVAGLDPAFSSGGDSCILRLGFLGQDTNGRIVLDFRNNDLLFNIPINPNRKESAEIQISEEVVRILNKFGCPMNCLAIDAGGQGRALGGTIQIYAKSHLAPIKIYCVRTGNKKDKSFDVVPKTRHELWFDVRKFIESGNIKGIDNVSLAQLTSRLVTVNEKTGKQELESKSEYKKRMGAIMPSLAHSPDEADALSLCLQAAIINYGFTPGQRVQIPDAPSNVMNEIAAWKANVKAVQEDYLKGKPAELPKANFSSMGITAFRPIGSSK